VEDLRRLVLNGLNLNLMWRILSLTMTQRFLKSLNRVERDGMTPRTQEKRQLFHQGLTANEESTREPHQFPASFFAQSVSIVGQLFHDLAVNFVA
jgi:hypothetical protein